MSKTELITSSSRLYNILSDPKSEVTGFLSINHEKKFLTQCKRNIAAVLSKLTNTVIAAYVTVLARLKLYEYLEKLDRRVLYSDTDSCIFLSTRDEKEYMPETENVFC